MSGKFTQEDFTSINVKADSEFSSYTSEKIKLVGLDEDVYDLLINTVPTTNDVQLGDEFGDDDLLIKGNLVSLLLELNRQALHRTSDIYVKTLYSFLEALERKKYGRYRIIQRNYGQDKNELNTLNNIIKRINTLRRERDEYYKQ